MPAAKSTASSGSPLNASQARIGTNAFAAGEDDVIELRRQLRGLDPLDNRLEAVLDQRNPALQVLHLPQGRSDSAKA